MQKSSLASSLALGNTDCLIRCTSSRIPPSATKALIPMSLATKKASPLKPSMTLDMRLVLSLMMSASMVLDLVVAPSDDFGDFAPEALGASVDGNFSYPSSSNPASNSSRSFFSSSAVSRPALAAASLASRIWILRSTRNSQSWKDWGSPH